ncbi:hypothetical protein Tco_0521947 [Tanacetum coccineum]
MHEVVLFYNGLDVPTRQILDLRGAIPSKTAADTKIAIQEMAEYSQKREIKKVNEKVYAAQVGCEQCKGPYYTKDYPLKEEEKTLEEAYYTQFGGPFQGGGFRAQNSSGVYQRNNANPSYQERRQSMEDTLSKFMSESAKRHEENSHLIKEIRELRASINFLPLSTYLNLGLGELAHTKLTVELENRTVKYPKGIVENMLVDFAVLEDMDAYHDERMGDVIFGEPFLREVKINAIRLDGMITIHYGNEEVTYQMVQTHPRFKHHTNEQCKKIPLLLKVSEEDRMNGISHSCQKLKSFYKGVLNLGLEYVRDAKMEEWLTRGHISVH